MSSLVDTVAEIENGIQEGPVGKRIGNELENDNFSTTPESDSEIKTDYSAKDAKDKDNFSENDADEDTVSHIALPKKPASAYIAVSIICVMIAFGGYIPGYDTGTIGGFESHPDFKRRFGSRNKSGVYYLSKVRAGLLTATQNLGQACGVFFLGRVGDLYGRRIGIAFAASIFIAGVIIEIASIHAWYQYMIGRIVSGLGCGLFAVLCPMLISEVAPKHLRGALVATYQLMVTMGIFLGYCSNYGTQYYDDSRQWRIPLGLQFAWALFLITAMVFVPESPRYLIENGRFEDAKRSIGRSNRVNPDDPAVIYEAEYIQVAIEKEREEGKAKWKDLLDVEHKILQRVINGIAVMGLQQLTGANYFFYYGTLLFHTVGMKNGYEGAIIIGTVNFFSTFIGLYIIERFGRRTCLLWGCAGMICCMVVFASVGVTRLWPEGKNAGISSKGAGNCMIVFTSFFLFCFAATWGPVPHVIIAESFPLRVKAKCMALATVSNQLWNFCIGFFTPFITGSINFYYGYVFLGCLCLAWLYVFFLVPETKGLILEDVNVMWEEGVLAWKSANWVPPSQREADYDINAMATDDKPIWKRMFGK
ncbi:hypothetical protein TBLA_0A03410 [Henningerozyma blattae CBS 6284]|uniref:Major facilitator superfamily (MFS) profile domain-containing protein n=1 Tax=Henningerozyma blattae (strain ATCC 34711 / CBS 6284 / DSM 70876 / NBRC 10599 / NRRL Y-10934 / UCD 77-7) TaxID=1071380 RepID=I2GVI9_HENB6|nr:hypothetical protein TBLA_0A03410 [Tetrapisispora blattae CBS 6284]CCH58141.1 hypothetical protein TBLA_0A03410 [Tetrapisispora blattae CBS 6284]